MSEFEKYNEMGIEELLDLAIEDGDRVARKLLFDRAKSSNKKISEFVLCYRTASLLSEQQLSSLTPISFHQKVSDELVEKAVDILLCWPEPKFEEAGLKNSPEQCRDFLQTRKDNYDNEPFSKWKEQQQGQLRALCDARLRINGKIKLKLGIKNA
jgi:hypothetical protein